MLVSLHVKQMALIEEEEIRFGEGLNILSGETGAGKSIIIGSIGVALGSGRFGDYVPEKAESALSELVFETTNERVLQKLDEAGIDRNGGQIIISRKYQKGRSISRVNGESVPVGFVKELSADLLDIHGQHEHQSLLYPKFHLELLDRHSAQDLAAVMPVYGETYRRWREVKRELEESLLDEGAQARELDLLRYEMQEIDEAALQIGEDTLLEADFRKMENGLKIMEALGQADQLAGSGDGAGDMVSRAAREMQSVASFDNELSQLYEQLSQAEDLLSDFERSLHAYMDDFSYDEQTFYDISQRLDLINHLKARYGSSIEEILAYRDRQAQKAEKLENYEAYTASLRTSERELKSELLTLAARISGIRKKHAKLLETQITQSLVDLNFLDVRFDIEFKQTEEPTSSGTDEICFLISTNPGMPLRPLQDTASGGELSRIMLAIKSVMADQDAIETLIFDEIDTGISGRTAQKVSEKMSDIASGHQVICITHLAQIAAMADHHYVIEKQAESGMTVTHIRELDEAQCAGELARIIGGVEITDAVMDSAKEMRKLALARKQQVKKASEEKEKA